MTNVLADFQNREKEIDSYFQFLEKIINKNPKLFFSANKTRQYQEIDKELLKILKANAFLLLYNLVESTIKNSLDAIYDDLRVNNVSFNSIKDSFKKIILKNLKNGNADTISTQLTNISIDIISESYKTDTSISGNLDAKKIREIAEIYGFSHTTHKNARGGNKLLTVKTNRNSLAHGNTTFSDCGKNYTIEDLIQIKKEVILYVRGTIYNIRNYLLRAEYNA